MAITFEQFFRAIAQQESGNRYTAVGPLVRGNRAYGKYQVMDFNIPSWTRQYYGQALTPQQFLNNPSAQEAVARGKLQTYWNQYGARGAASAWYSGNPNLHMSTRAQSGGPSIKSYVDSVLRIASGISPGAGSSTSIAPAVNYQGDQAVQMTPSEQAESYGLSLRLVNSNKELKNLFGQATKNNWSSARFQAALKNTKWWRTQSSDVRKYLTLQHTDPATWKQNRDNATAAIRAMAYQAGATLTDGQLNDAVYAKLANGWSDARIRNWLGGYVKQVDGRYTGAAAETFGDLNELAYQLGMSYSSKWYQNAVTKIASGKSTLAEHDAYIRNQAAAKYTAYSAQIRAGMSVQDLAAPFVEAVSRILEQPATDIDVLSNKHVRRAMESTPTGLPTQMWEFENRLRSDPLWRKTKNAQDSMMSTARGVLRDFGFGY